jgi:hypothetical protein
MKAAPRLAAIGNAMYDATASDADRHLAKDSARATNEYARVTNELLAQIGTLSPVGYRRKQEEVGHARTEAFEVQCAVSSFFMKHRECWRLLLAF